MTIDKLTLIGWARATWVSLCLALVACGGGIDGSSVSSNQLSGVGIGDTGLAEGTVTGFGSVIVDGIEYDDANASSVQDDGTGTTVNTDLKLGQRVKLTLNADNSVASVAVLPQLVGMADTAPDTSGSLQVMRQRVRLAGSASDPTQSPVAVLAGFGGAGIAAGDLLEIHGSWVLDNQLAGYVLIASRIEKLSVQPALLQLSGVVQAITGSSLLLNSATGLVIQTASLPTGVVVGHLVRVWLTPTAWHAMSSNTLQASRVVDGTLTAELLADKTLRLSGMVANYNAALRTVEVQGTQIQLDPKLQLDEQALARGAFVSLAIQRSGGILVASGGTQRGAVGTPSDLGQSVTLKAITNGIDWSSDPVSLTLRGVSVTAAASTLSASCRQANPNIDLMVEVTGRWSQIASTVLASQVQCTPTASMGQGAASHATTMRSGIVSKLNLSAHTFSLQTAQGVVAVLWDAQTFFSDEFNRYPESLTGQRVEVEGVNQTGMLRARTIKPIR